MSEEAEWVVYLSTHSTEGKPRYACESLEDWEWYAKEYPDYPVDEQLIARGLTEAQAQTMVALSKGERYV